MSKTFLLRDGDIWADRETGKTFLIDGASKAAQDIAETMLTEYDSSRRYGFEFASVNQPVILAKSASSLIKVKIREAIDRLKALQQEDAYSTADERINEIKQLIVKDLGGGNYLFFLNIYLENGSSINRMVAVSLRHLQESPKVVRPFKFTRR